MTLDAEQYQQSLALVNCCMSLVFVCFCISNQQVFTPLYRGVKDTLEIASTLRRVVWSLIKITNDLLPDMVIVLCRINFKCISSLKEHCCRHSCYSSLDAETQTLNVFKFFHSGEGGCTVRTIFLCQHSLENKHWMFSNSFKSAVASLFQSSAMLDEIQSIEHPLKL